MPVGELLDRMSAYEETAWAALYQVEPFGDHRADLRSAQITHMLYTVNAGKKAQRKTLADFLPFYRKKATEDENVSEKIRDRFMGLIKGK